VNHPRPVHLSGTAYDPLALLATVLIGTGGALLARAVGTPLPWLLGAVVAVGIAALAGVRIAGAPVQFPVQARMVFVPVIGVAIGGAVTPDLMRDAARWWPSLAALCLFIPAAHLASYALFRRVGRLDGPTAWFAAMPGGLIEAVAMGEANGADARMLSLLQFLRLILCILIVPTAFMLIEGVAVGSASGTTIEAGGALGPWDIAVLFACGALGLLVGRRIGLPAALVTGPILLSGAAHLAGITDAVPPPWSIALTQLVVGLTLGIRFAGLSGREIRRGVLLTTLSVGMALGIAALFGLVLSGIVGERIEAVVLAFAPGGVVEMSLVAISLEIGVLYVTAHHVARIVLAVLFARLGFGRIAGR